MAKLQILISMIAGGKTTYSKRAADKGIICVNDDAIVTMLHGGNYTSYNKELKVLYKAIEHTIIEVGVALNKTILIDRGLNISMRARKRYLAIADSLDIECEALWLPNLGPHYHAEARFKKENRGHSLEYWEKVSRYHDLIWKEPELSEGFSKIVRLERDCEVVI